MYNPGPETRRALLAADAERDRRNALLGGMFVFFAVMVAAGVLLAAIAR